jgi:2-dehydropantoate 2-reductase
MNIVIFGAGAIGSLFGALLSKNNNVILLGRKPHVDVIKNKGLQIIGKTIFNEKLSSTNNIKNINKKIDLIILTVKSYDTAIALSQIINLVDNNTIILTIQNGLDNLEKIKQRFNSEQIIGGVTTQGALFVKPGLIKHTGIGVTFLGELNGNHSNRMKNIVRLFNNSKISTKLTSNILEEIWIKGIINSSINPLTTIFRCKNGYLLKNPILFNMVKLICDESSNIAIKEGFDIDYDDVFKRNIDVIKDTCDNYSSMYQSFIKNKKTEIDSINGKFISTGKKLNADTYINQILVKLIFAMI